MKLKHYSEEFKQDAVKKHLTLGLTYPVVRSGVT